MPLAKAAPPRPAPGAPALAEAPGTGTGSDGTATGPSGDTAPPRPLRDTAALHAEILARLGPSPLAEDQLIRDLASPAQAVTPALVALELDGHITRHPGGLVSRTV
jgi:DNA processing protein